MMFFFCLGNISVESKSVQGNVVGVEKPQINISRDCGGETQSLVNCGIVNTLLCIFLHIFLIIAILAFSACLVLIVYSFFN